MRLVLMSVPKSVGVQTLRPTGLRHQTNVILRPDTLA